MFFTILGGVLAFVLTVLAIPLFIRFYQKARIGGQQMHEDVKQHQAKAGTPTMGGTVFLLVALVLSLMVTGLTQVEWSTYGILFIIALYGMVGFLDDFLKIFKQINEGLNPKQKMGLQIVGGIIFYIFHAQHHGTGLLNVFGYQVNLGWFYLFFVLFWLVGFSNAVNLTDGIDGLSSISVVISLAAYGVIAYKQGQMDVLMVCV
ncbi:phospho-N-acetylmuramoyl-pentapeptide-transferase, partial [Enterococcus faecalis]|nr:phospho-N-acetylmuramoyl-pentapeptide-transferase [Enterococcus faecalis]